MDRKHLAVLNSLAEEHSGGEEGFKNGHVFLQLLCLVVLVTSVVVCHAEVTHTKKSDLDLVEAGSLCGLDPIFINPDTIPDRTKIGFGAAV